MADRRIFSKELGLYFESLRKAKEWRQTTAAEIAKRRGYRALTYNAIRYLEEGKTKHPDKDVLLDASKLYGVPYDELVSRCIEAHYGVKMVPVTGADRKALPTAAGVVPFSQTERKLLQEFRRLPANLQRRLIGTVKDIADLNHRPLRNHAVAEKEESAT